MWMTLPLWGRCRLLREEELDRTPVGLEIDRGVEDWGAKFSMVETLLVVEEREEGGADKADEEEGWSKTERPEERTFIRPGRLVLLLWE